MYPQQRDSGRFQFTSEPRMSEVEVGYIICLEPKKKLDFSYLESRTAHALLPNARTLEMWLDRDGASTWFVYMPPGSSLYVGHQRACGQDLFIRRMASIGVQRRT